MADGGKKSLERFNTTVVTIRNLQWVAGTLVGAGAVIAVGIVKLKPPAFLGYILVGCCAFALGAVVVGLVAARRQRHATARTGFRILEYKMEYVFDPDDHRKHICRRTYKLEASAHDAMVFCPPYLWSGAGAVKAKIESRGHQIVGEVSGSGAQRWFVIFLGRKYRRGESVDLVYSQQLRDSQGKFGHFISKKVDEPIKRVELSVAFPRSLENDPRVSAASEPLGPSSIFRSGKRDITNEVQRQERSYTLTVDRPKVGRNYVLDWTWPVKY